MDTGRRLGVPYAAPSGALVAFGQRDVASGDEPNLVWDAATTGALLVDGRLGTGIASMLRTLLRHALVRPETWEAVVITRAVRFGDGARSAMRVCALDDAEAEAVTAELADLCETRLDALQDLGIPSIAALDAFGSERPRRVMVLVEDPASYPERVVERLGRLVRRGGAAGVHVAALGGRTALLPAPMRDGFGARAVLPEMMSGRVSYAEAGGDPAWGHVRPTGARELEELAASIAPAGAREA